MRKKLVKKKFYYYVLLFLGLMLILSLSLLYNRLISYPAYLSVKTSCNFESVQEANKDLGNVDRMVAGATVRDVNTDEVFIYLYVNDTITLRHEICHVLQIKDKRLNECSQPIRKWFDEQECYIRQYLPMDVDKYTNSSNILMP